MRHVPAAPDWRERTEASFARQDFMTTIGARILELAPGVCVLGLDVRDGLRQQHGFVHAGVTTALADSAGGYAAFTLFPAASEVLTVTFTINLLAPARGERLVATGRVARSGRTLTVCEVDVVAHDGAVATPVAKLQQTLMRVAAE